MSIEDREFMADVLDIGAANTQAMTDGIVEASSLLAAPEQKADEEGRPTVFECVDCGEELGPRALLFKIRCLDCQERLERRRGF